MAKLVRKNCFRLQAAMFLILWSIATIMHMRTGITLILLLITVTVSAQHKKPFFNTLYFTAMAGEEVNVIDRTQWKNMYANRPKFPYQLDTMTFDYQSVPKCGIFLPSFSGAGGSISLGKTLIDTKTGWWSRKLLEWRSSIHFKSSYYNAIRYGGYTNILYPMDTTKTTIQDNVSLSQNKRTLEWQNMINFKTGPIFNSKFRFNIGTGIGISHTVKNTISERYNQTAYTWNSGLHYFNNQSTAFSENSFKAKPQTRIFYLLYMGTEIKLSSQISFIGDFHYTLSHNKYSSVNPKTESYWLGLTFSYSFN